jgi:REP element-mobilizing transposase RayT
MPPIVRLKGLIQHVCDETQSGLIEMEVMPDHVHLLLDWDPQFGIHRLGARHQGSDIACASAGISGVADMAANTLDERLFRQHRGWRTARSDQAIYRKSEARLMRAKTSSFVAEFALCTTTAGEAALPIRLDATRNVCNASLGESLRRLDLMRESLDWQRARSMPAMLGTNAKGKPIPNKERSDLFKAT